MGIGASFKALRQTILPQGKIAPVGGVSETKTFNPNNQVLNAPIYKDHLIDIVSTRVNSDSRAILKELFKHDPDVSAAVNAYLTVANAADPIFMVYNQDNQLDREGQKRLTDILVALTKDSDYKSGFRFRQSIRTISEGMRYMLLLRGACAQELILDKLRLPAEIRTIDMATVKFEEKAVGKYLPYQEVSNGRKIYLDYPTVIINYFHRDPTDVYSYSHFVSSINTIAARQQVINTLYRIMNVNGFPRLTVEVLEDIVMKSAPSDVQADTQKRQSYLNGVLGSITNAVSNLRPEQAFVHTDSIKPEILAPSRSGAEIKIDSVINTLNDQNQAALKTMSTIIGRGDAGVNTSSVEARIFAMNADELNNPVAECWETILTLALRLTGYAGYVECYFQPIELRPDLELEPQKVMRQSRLHKDLSLGLISDDEYHLMMYNRFSPEGSPTLSGTLFDKGTNTDVSPSANSDPLGRSLNPEGSKSAKSNTVK